jgi:hypothetical protein
VEWSRRRRKISSAVDPVEANALRGGLLSLCDSVVVSTQTLISNGCGASVGLEDWLYPDWLRFVGIAAAIYTYQTGAGPLGAIIVAFVAGGFTLALGRYAFSVARSPIVRLLIGLLFAVPAARAGYDVTLALAHFGIPQEWWRESFAMLGAICRREHRLGPGVDLDRARS